MLVNTFKRFELSSNIGTIWYTEYYIIFCCSAIVYLVGFYYFKKTTPQIHIRSNKIIILYST